MLYATLKKNISEQVKAWTHRVRSSLYGVDLKHQSFVIRYSRGAVVLFERWLLKISLLCGSSLQQEVVTHSTIACKWKTSFTVFLLWASS